jgi:uncharacterized protein YacL
LYWRKILTIKEKFIMNANIKTMLWTAGSIVVALLVADMIKKRLAKKTETTSSFDE